MVKLQKMTRPSSPAETITSRSCHARVLSKLHTAPMCPAPFLLLLHNKLPQFKFDAKCNIILLIVSHRIDRGFLWLRHVTHNNFTAVETNQQEVGVVARKSQRSDRAVKCVRSLWLRRIFHRPTAHESALFFL